jgi:hypothetical protein
VLAALKLEEAVLEFLTDSSKPSLEFPPSTSNYEVTELVIELQLPLLHTGTQHAACAAVTRRRHVHMT